jgi:ribonuclease HII
MVTAGVLVADIAELGGFDLRDSKQLTPRRREKLHSEIINLFEVATVVCTPAEIDSRMGTMNALTAFCHAAVIQSLAPDVAYVDACDVNATRFGLNVRELSGMPELQMISEHKADDKFPIVGAASIVAKVTRDRLVAELSNEYGDLGSGYPSDPVTIRFLETYIRGHGYPPSCARKSWKTIDEIIARVSQLNFTDFF